MLCNKLIDILMVFYFAFAMRSYASDKINLNDIKIGSPYQIGTTTGIILEGTIISKTDSSILIHDGRNQLIEANLISNYKFVSSSESIPLIGITVSATLKDNDGLPRGPVVINNVFPHSPACKTGLLEKDTIIQIDKLITSGRQLEEIIKRFQGPIGTNINILVKRPSFSKEIVITLEREKTIEPNIDNGNSCNDTLAFKSLNERFANLSAYSDFSIAAQSVDPILLKEYIARYSRINNNSSIFCLDSARSLLNKKEREWLKLSLYSKKHPTFFENVDSTTFKTGYNNSSLNQDNLFNFQVSIKGLKPEIESVFRFYLDTLINDFKRQKVKLRFPASILIDYSKEQPVIQLTSHINVALDIDIFKYLQTSKKMFQIMGGVYAANIMHQYKRKVMQKFTYYLQSKNATQFDYQEYLNKIKSALYVIIMYKNNNEYIVQYADNPRFLDNQNYDTDVKFLDFLDIKLNNYKLTRVENYNSPFGGRNFGLHSHVILPSETSTMSGVKSTSMLIYNFFEVSE
jgi:hypothetical protein